MTIEQLSCFIAVVEEHTFFDAAERLHMTQPTLSKQIQKLEKELDITLLDRSRRNATVTAAGTCFYEEAKLLYAQYRSMLQKLSVFQVSQENVLHIGTLPFTKQYGLSAQIQAFSRLHPQLKIHLEEVEEQELLDGFKTGTFDLIFSRKHLLADTPSVSTVIYEDELAAVLWTAHPLSGHSCVALADLATENFLLMKPYTAIHQLCCQLFAQHHIKANITHTARPESLLGAVAIKEGVSLLAMSTMEVYDHKDVQYLPLSPKVSLPIVLAANKKTPMTQSMQLFWDYFTEDK